MVDAGWPGQGGQQGRDKPWQQAGGGRWQPPEWRDRQQRHEQVNGPPQPTYYGPTQPPSRPPGRSWPARHKALTGLLAGLALVIIAVAAHSSGSSSPGNGTRAGLTTTVSATATETPSHHATRTAAAARTTQPRGTPAAAAVPPAPAAQPLPTTHGPVPTTSAAAPTTHAPAPTKPAPTTSAPTTPPAVAPSTSAAPAGCHPLTNSGKCYEPGEFCRAADHGASGVAGDGEAITCEDNGGWRWEPS